MLQGTLLSRCVSARLTFGSYSCRIYSPEASQAVLAPPRDWNSRRRLVQLVELVYPSQYRLDLRDDTTTLPRRSARPPSSSWYLRRGYWRSLVACKLFMTTVFCSHGMACVAVGMSCLFRVFMSVCALFVSWLVGFCLLFGMAGLFSSFRHVLCGCLHVSACVVFMPWLVCRVSISSLVYPPV